MLGGSRIGSQRATRVTQVQLQSHTNSHFLSVLCHIVFAVNKTETEMQNVGLAQALESLCASAVVAEGPGAKLVPAHCPVHGHYSPSQAPPAGCLLQILRCPSFAPTHPLLPLCLPQPRGSLRLPPGAPLGFLCHHPEDPPHSH